MASRGRTVCSAGSWRGTCRRRSSGSAAGRRVPGPEPTGAAARRSSCRATTTADVAALAAADPEALVELVEVAGRRWRAPAGRRLVPAGVQHRRRGRAVGLPRARARARRASVRVAARLTPVSWTGGSADPAGPTVRVAKGGRLPADMTTRQTGSLRAPRVPHGARPAGRPQDRRSVRRRRWCPCSAQGRAAAHRRAGLPAGRRPRARQRGHDHRAARRGRTRRAAARRAARRARLGPAALAGRRRACRRHAPPADHRAPRRRADAEHPLEPRPHDPAEDAQPEALRRRDRRAHDRLRDRPGGHRQFVGPKMRSQKSPSRSGLACG